MIEDHTTYVITECAKMPHSQTVLRLLLEVKGFCKALQLAVTGCHGSPGVPSVPSVPGVFIFAIFAIFAFTFNLTPFVAIFA